MRHMTAHAKLIEMLNDDKVSASHLALLQEETEMITSSLSACLQEGLEGTVCRGPKIEQRHEDVGNEATTRGSRKARTIA